MLNRLLTIQFGYKCDVCKKRFSSVHKLKTWNFEGNVCDVCELYKKRERPTKRFITVKSSCGFYLKRLDYMWSGGYEYKYVTEWNVINNRYVPKLFHSIEEVEQEISKLSNKTQKSLVGQHL